MMFQYDRLLILLLLVPVAAWWLWRYFQKRTIARSKFAESSLWRVIAPQERPWVRPARIIIITLALFCLLIAVARPKGGEVQTEATSEGIDIYLLLDLSKSMYAEDVGASRFIVQQKIAEAIVKSNPSDRIGLIGFTGQPYVICPLTLDHDTLITFLDSTTIDENSPVPGTGYGDAIELALKRFESDKGRAIVLSTDGENNKGNNPIKTARDALRDGVKIFTIGIGTENGTRLMERDFFNRPIPRTYRGEPVIVKLDKGTLKEIASITNAKSYFVESVNDAQGVFVDFDKASKSIFKSGMAMLKKELAGYFLLAAAILMILDFIIDRFRLIPRKRVEAAMMSGNNSNSHKSGKQATALKQNT
jgi:Ca-activated chloride channel homolog